jgi:hypothetical protein
VKDVHAIGFLLSMLTMRHIILLWFCQVNLLFSQAMMTVTPSSVLVGSSQKVRFEFTVGSSGISSGGGVRLELPVGNLETEPCFWDRPQIELPDARGFVQASTSANAEIKIRLYGRRGGIIECFVNQGSLQRGDKVLINYAGVVQSLSWNLSIRVEVRQTAEHDWSFLERFPEMTFIPQKAVTLTAVTPADVQVSEPFDLAVVLLDKFGNQASGYRGEIALASTDALMAVKASHVFTQGDSGVYVFRGLRHQTTGFHRITLTDGALVTHSNYSAVRDSMPRYQRFFGDSHFHTGTGTGNLRTNGRGGDHRGYYTTAEQAYRYVKGVMRLDFASSSEHDVPELTERVWQGSQAISNAFYEPGRFTTFFAYEWTAPVGHHVVAYKDSGNAVISRHQYGSLDTLWRKLDEQGVPTVTIPHVTWPSPDHRIWETVNNRYRKIGEIYSLWNNRWLLQPADDPQRFEVGIKGAWSYQYAWAKGHRIGVIGSSDNHTGHPGANNYTVYTQHTGGLAAVLAAENTREAIWDAFQRRRTYATTGTRILLDFTSDSHPMGAEYSSETPPEFSVKVAGTNTISTVQLIKHDSSGYHTIYTQKPDSTISVFEFVDDEFKEDSFYYVRVTQVDEYWRSPWANTSSEMAWSSPIWIDYVEQQK